MSSDIWRNGCKTSRYVANGVVYVKVSPIPWPESSREIYGCPKFQEGYVE